MKSCFVLGPANPAGMVLLFLLLANLSGCTGIKTTTEPAADIPIPDYAQLAENYNRRTRQIRQMWARAVVEFEWTEEDGKKRFEQGDGPLILRKPRQTALAIGKLGENAFWFGSDHDRFWLFWLRPAEGEPKTAYVGRHEDLAEGLDNPLPIPIRPDMLISLLGLDDLPAAPHLAGPIEVKNGKYRVRLHTRPTADGPIMTLEIDPATLRPARIDTWSPGGRLLLSSEPGRYEPMEQKGVPLGAWPAVPARVVIHVPEKRMKLTVFLSEISDGEPDRVRDVQFDFERLVKIHQPQEVRTLRSALKPVPQAPDR